ncbi:MAG: DUF3499 family protein [Acidimicrobiales bacterium]
MEGTRRSRFCARPGCSRPAAASLTFQYSTGVAWLDDLSEPEPCAIDLCDSHADRMIAPRGWQGHDRRAGASAQVAS